LDKITNTLVLTDTGFVKREPLTKMMQIGLKKKYIQQTYPLKTLSKTRKFYKIGVIIRKLKLFEEG